MIKTILFDLDGTLLNTIDDLADAANWVCTQHGWPTFPVETYKHFVGNGIPKLVERFSPENARTPEQLAATLAEFSARYDAHKEDKNGPLSRILELLAALKAEAPDRRFFQQSGRFFVERSSSTTSARTAFRWCGAGRPGVPTKPDPAGVYSLMADLGAAPESTLFVGDSDVDILTGHNAGLPALGVLWGFRGRSRADRRRGRCSSRKAGRYSDVSPPALKNKSTALPGRRNTSWQGRSFLQKEMMKKYRE